MMAILGFFIGPIGRWVAISILSVGFMAWIRSDARAPYADAVTDLKRAIVKQHQNSERDRQLAEANATKAQELEDELQKIQTPNGTRLSGDELGRLRKLAGGNPGVVKVRTPAR